jgi:hypothetical protein
MGLDRFVRYVKRLEIVASPRRNVCQPCHGSPAVLNVGRIEISGGPLKGRDGATRGGVAGFRDITGDLRAPLRHITGNTVHRFCA